MHIFSSRAVIQSLQHGTRVLITYSLKGELGTDRSTKLKDNSLTKAIQKETVILREFCICYYRSTYKTIKDLYIHRILF